MTILVAGGGIAGLATALALALVDFEVEVHEAAAEIAGQGLGMNLQPFAVRELAALGLSAALESGAAPIERWSLYNRHGQLVWSEPRGRAAGLAWPQCAVSRGRLQMLLLEHLRERAPGVRVATEHRLVDFAQEAAGVAARFVAPASGGECVVAKGQALIGADGLHSTVRRALYPGEQLRFGGQLMWRQATRRAPFLDGKTGVIVGHREQKFVAYPMSPPEADGRVLVNWLVELASGTKAPPRQDWNGAVGVERLCERFADWRFGWIDVPELLAEAGRVLEFPKVDRDPVPRWTFGPVTLVGDAAHPMTPAGAQGGSQAIVDARALAFHMAAWRDDIPRGLVAYEEARRPATTEIALRNRAMGAEVVLDLAETRAPTGFSDLEHVLPSAERARLADDYRRAAGLLAGDVNRESPYRIN